MQTCRGSHTHTVVTDPRDKDNVYIYVSGSAARALGGRAARLQGRPDRRSGQRAFPSRSDQGAAGGAGEGGDRQLAAHLLRPRAASATRRAGPWRAPARGADAGAPRSAPRRCGSGSALRRAAGDAGAAAAGGGAAAAARGNTGPNQCHDITVYPDIGLAGGACGGYGLLLDIKDVVNPKRIDQAADINMSFWHSATFSNDGTKILFSDEWGGGSQPRCRDTDKLEWGADALFTIENGKMNFKSYYKMPAPQTSFENCVAHNGSLIPIPGREVMVQGWYQGGISVFDWTDASKPKEIAYFDRGPLDATRLITAGSWSVYWYNGLIVSSEIRAASTSSSCCRAGSSRRTRSTPPRRSSSTT